MTRSLHLPYKPYKTTFARIFLFLETVGLSGWRVLYAIQYNIIQYDTAQHNLTQNNTIKCTIQYAFRTVFTPQASLNSQESMLYSVLYCIVLFCFVLSAFRTVFTPS